MPAYDYRCRTCDTTFEVRRTLTAPSDARARCPAGHPDTTRVFSPVAVASSTPAARSSPAGSSPAAAAGGCCGGGCCG